jgi:predicted GNAT superfamily acetyltransferase
MARITPKTNWVGADIPVAPDFNRIENNNEQAFAELDQASVNLSAEQSARISSDNTLQNNIDAANTARIAGDLQGFLLPGESFTAPAGTNFMWIRYNLPTVEAVGTITGGQTLAPSGFGVAILYWRINT